MELTIIGANSATQRLADWLSGSSITLRRASAPGIEPQHVGSQFDPGSSLVLVGGGVPYQWDDALRDWARRGIPLILVMPPCSGIVALELDLIQQDTGALLIPFHLPSLFPGWPIIARLIGDVPIEPEQQESPISRPNRLQISLGTMERIEWIRWSADRSDNVVRSFLAQDGLVLRQLLGHFQQVNAVVPGLNRTSSQRDVEGSSASRLEQLDVRITGPGNVVAHWRVDRDADRSGVQMTLVGSNGRLVFDLPDHGTWTSREDSADSSYLGFPWTEQDRRQALTKFFQQVEESNSVWPNWEDACRSLELVDLAEESARRGKSLTVFNERLTEQDTFHGMMAAGGCFLLLGMLGLVLSITLVDAFRLPIRNWELWRNWPVGILGVLAIFLLLQLLKLAYRK